MTSWRGLRHEIAGAWRSLRYDLERRRPRPADEEETTDLIFPEYGTARPPRRILAAGGFGTLAVAGAVGTYFAVATGLGLLIDDGAGGQPSALPGTAGNRAAVSDLGAAELGDDEPGAEPRDKGVGVGMLDKGGAIVAREGRPAGRITDAGKQAAIEEAGGSGPAAVPTPTRTKTPSPRPWTPSPRPSNSTGSPTPSPSTTSPSPSPTPSPSPSSESPSPSPDPDPDPSSSGSGEGGSEPPTGGGGGPSAGGEEAA